MASRSAAVVFAAAVVMAAVVMAAVILPSSEAALSCATVYQSLMPCLDYLESGGVNPPPGQCCSGISNLMAQATTAQDRRTACTCLKTAAAGVTGLNLNLAGTLPRKCGVNVPYKISPSTDCNKVN